jgi:hypothetical protein
LTRVRSRPTVQEYSIGKVFACRPLIIDPAILFAAEGSIPGEQAFAVAVDAVGGGAVML